MEAAKKSLKPTHLAHPVPKPQVDLALHTNTSNGKSRDGHRSASKSANSRSGNKSGEHSVSRPCQEHSFLTDVADVRQMEQGLLQLLEDFHSNKLQAFNNDCTFEKMDQVREQQERLARLHFELDGQQEIQGLDTAEARDTASKNLGKLMENLQELCVSIQHLQKDNTEPVSHSKHGGKS